MARHLIRLIGDHRPTTDGYVSRIDDRRLLLETDRRKPSRSRCKDYGCNAPSGSGGCRSHGLVAFPWPIVGPVASASSSRTDSGTRSKLPVKATTKWSVKRFAQRK